MAFTQVNFLSLYLFVVWPTPAPVLQLPIKPELQPSPELMQRPSLRPMLQPSTEPELPPSTVPEIQQPSLLVLLELVIVVY